MRDKATTKALAAAENPHFANAIVAELDDPSMGPEVANYVRRWNHYQVFTTEQERELLLKGFIESSPKLMVESLKNQRQGKQLYGLIANVEFADWNAGAAGTARGLHSEDGSRQS